MIARMRSRREAPNVSATKSIDQRSFGRSGTGIGVRLPRARRPGVARSGNPAPRRAPRPVAELASSDFSLQVLQDGIVEHGLGQQPLKLAVLLLKQPQPPGIGHLKPALLRLQLVERRRAQTVLAAELRRRKPGILLLRVGQTLHQIEGASGGQVSPIRQHPSKKES